MIDLLENAETYVFLKWHSVSAVADLIVYKSVKL